MLEGFRARIYKIRDGYAERYVYVQLLTIGDGRADAVSAARSKSRFYGVGVGGGLKRPHLCA
jgi:hypothetical protein